MILCFRCFCSKNSKLVWYCLIKSQTDTNSKVPCCFDNSNILRSIRGAGEKCRKSINSYVRQGNGVSFQRNTTTGWKHTRTTTNKLVVIRLNIKLNSLLCYQHSIFHLRNSFDSEVKKANRAENKRTLLSLSVSFTRSPEIDWYGTGIVWLISLFASRQSIRTLMQIGLSLISLWK